MQFKQKRNGGFHIKILQEKANKYNVMQTHKVALPLWFAQAPLLLVIREQKTKRALNRFAIGRLRNEKASTLI